MKPTLLVYLAHSQDHTRYALGVALAGIAQRAGWGFDCYHDSYRAGRHWGGGDPMRAPSGWPSGSLVAGGRHADQVLWLATEWHLLVAGDPQSVLVPALASAGAELVAMATTPADVMAAVLDRAGAALPERCFVLDGQAQGVHGLVTAPYLYPEVLAEGGAAVDVSLGASGREALEKLGARSFEGRWVDCRRAAAFPGGLDGSTGDAAEATWATFTAGAAARAREWGRGVFLGDPGLVAAQLGKAARLQLLPLYGQPQVDVVDQASEVIAAAAEPVFGRQYDDRDFLALARLGHGLQVLDPAPPFDAAAAHPRLPVAPAPAAPAAMVDEPDADTLESWRAGGRVLVTAFLWAGMVREVDLWPRLVDLVAATGLRAGLVITADAVAHAPDRTLDLLVTPVDRGGAAGRLELVLGSTGRGVAMEGLLPPGRLAEHLASAQDELRQLLPPELLPRGWWPLLDTELVRSSPGPLVVERGRPLLRYHPRGGSPIDAGPHELHGRRAALGGRTGFDVRAAAGRLVRTTGLGHFVRERRPFDDVRPGPFRPEVARAVASAGLDYLWTKAGFGRAEVVHRVGDLVALPFTAGNWDGWSPFYTLAGAGDVVAAERRLLRSGRPGWLAATIDSPLWAMSAEVLQHGSTLYRLAETIAAGGRAGSMVNVTPGVVARYARICANGTA